MEPGTAARGQRIARLTLTHTADGTYADDHDFVTGLAGPIDVEVGSDSALYIADMLADKIYRVTYAP